MFGGEQTTLDTIHREMIPMSARSGPAPSVEDCGQACDHSHLVVRVCLDGTAPRGSSESLLFVCSILDWGRCRAAVRVSLAVHRHLPVTRGTLRLPLPHTHVAGASP